MATAIIYAAGSGRVRRILSEVDLGDLRSHCDEGEAVALWDDNDVEPGVLPSVYDAEAHIAMLLGRMIPSSRCVVLDENNTVILALMADPLLDTYEGNLIVQDDDAQIGQTLQSDGGWL